MHVPGREYEQEDGSAHEEEDEDATSGWAGRLGGMEGELDHERLDVYQRSIEFLAIAVRMGARIGRGHAELKDQLHRASTSIPLNIAEASGKSSGADRARFHGVARGSALECGAIVDVLGVVGAAHPDDVRQAKALLSRIVAMLTKLCR